MLDGTNVARRARKEEEGPQDVATIALVICITKTPWLNYNYVGLILSPSSNEPGLVLRVGNVTNLPADWFEEGQVMTFILA